MRIVKTDMDGIEKVIDDKISNWKEGARKMVEVAKSLQASLPNDPKIQIDPAVYGISVWIGTNRQASYRLEV